MSKSTKRSRQSRRGTTDRSATTDVVTQLEIAARNPGAAAIGALIGGLVPWFGRTLAHGEIQDAWAAGSHGLALAMVAVVLGCGVFSGLSVYKFGRAAFGDPRKALGFVLALEGVMLISHGATSAVALAVLILINAVANGSVIALARDAAQRQRAADARGAAARARSRAAARGESSIPAPGAPQGPSPAARAAQGTVPPARGPQGSTPSTPLVYSIPSQNSRQSQGHEARGLVPTQWRRATLDDAPRAEILSAELLS